MTTTKRAAPATLAAFDEVAKLRQQYGCRLLTLFTRQAVKSPKESPACAMKGASRGATNHAALLWLGL